jgi:hypothetical protein
LTVFEDQANREGFSHLANSAEARRHRIGGIAFGDGVGMRLESGQVIVIICPCGGDSQYVSNNCRYDVRPSLCLIASLTNIVSARICRLFCIGGDLYGSAPQVKRRTTIIALRLSHSLLVLE